MALKTKSNNNHAIQNSHKDSNNNQYSIKTLSGEKKYITSERSEKLRINNAINKRPKSFLKEVFTNPTTSQNNSLNISQQSLTPNENFGIYSTNYQPNTSPEFPINYNNFSLTSKNLHLTANNQHQNFSNYCNYQQPKQSNQHSQSVLQVEPVLSNLPVLPDIKANSVLSAIEQTVESVRPKENVKQSLGYHVDNKYCGFVSNDVTKQNFKTVVSKTEDNKYLKTPKENNNLTKTKTTKHYKNSSKDSSKDNSKETQSKESCSKELLISKNFKEKKVTKNNEKKKIKKTEKNPIPIIKSTLKNKSLQQVFF